MHAGRTDRTQQHCPCRSELPTIWDRLAASAGSAARYYCGELHFLSLWGPKYTPDHAHVLATFFARLPTRQAAGGRLRRPAYTFPDAGVGTGNDDHPHADIRAGEWFLSQVYNAVTSSPAWPRTLLVVTFDEWGGFFDHVAAAAAPRRRTRVHTLRGFRVPTRARSRRSRGAARRARRLRPHVDPQADRVALGPAPLWPCATRQRRTSRWRSTSRSGTCARRLSPCPGSSSARPASASRR